MSNLSRFSALVERSHTGKRMENRLQRLVLRTVVQALRNTPYVTDWYPSLDDPLMARILNVHPRICEKVFRPYLCCGLSYRERHHSLMSQYHWLRAHLSEMAIESIFAGDGLEVGSLEIGGMGKYRLIIRYYDQFEMEGDLTLSLVRADGFRIYSMTFSVLEDNGNLHALIGGSQGGAGVSAETVRKLTKAMQGMRPKALVLFALMRVVKDWGAVSLSAIRNTGHVYNCFGFSLNRRKYKIQSDYDRLWCEAGGSISSDNPYLYDLPLIWSVKPLEQVPSRKRAMYHRRYSMLETLDGELDVRALAALIR